MSLLWSGLLLIALPALVDVLAPQALRLTCLALITATGAAASVVSQLLVAPWSDRSCSRFGRRRPFIVIGVLLTVVSLGLMAQVRTLWGLLGTLCLLQVVTSIVSVPYQALLPDLVPASQQGRASAVFSVSQFAGTVAGMVLAGVLLTGVGADGASAAALLFRQTTIFLGLSALFLLAVTPLVVRWAQETQGSPTPRLAVIPAVKEAFSFRLEEMSAFAHVFRSRFLSNMGFYVATGCLLFFVKDSLGRTLDKEIQAALLVVLAASAGVPGAVIGGRWADRHSRRTMILYSSGMAAAGLLLLAVSRSVPSARCAAGIFGLGWGAFAATSWAMACETMPGDRRAKGMAIWTVAFTLPQVLGPVLAGPLGDAVNRLAGIGAGERFIMVLALLLLLAGAFATPSRRGIPTPKEGLT